MRGLPTILLALAAASCQPEGPRPAPPPVAEAIVDRDAWWDGATKRPSGKERILAPRELRALLRTGQRHGFDGDAAWWEERSTWAYERILSVDPDDIEANGGVGRKTMQSIPGFDALWRRMLEADPTPEITDFLDSYEVQISGGRPLFLYADEYEVMKARLRDIEKHLEKTEADPGYAALQRALRRVRSGPLNDFPHLHVQVGPFLVFYTARDLQRIPGEDDAAEDARIAERREYYRRRLETWCDVYREVLEDIAKLYPKVTRRHPLGPRVIFYQWVFGEPTWYADFRERIHKDDPEPPYRSGFLHGATGWAYLVEPEEPEPPAPPAPGQPAQPAAEAPPKPEAVLRETAAYLAATQILQLWAKHPEDYGENFLDRSRAYWLKEGWPAFIAGRRVEKPLVGRVFDFKWAFPALQSVVERRSRIQREIYLHDPNDEWNRALPPDSGYTDLARRLVQHLNEEERRAVFEKFLLSQIEGTRHGIEWFEECFRVNGADGWQALQRAVYAPARDD